MRRVLILSAGVAVLIVLVSWSLASSAGIGGMGGFIRFTGPSMSRIPRVRPPVRRAARPVSRAAPRQPIRNQLPPVPRSIPHTQRPPRVEPRPNFHALPSTTPSLPGAVPARPAVPSPFTLDRPNTNPFQVARPLTPAPFQLMVPTLSAQNQTGLFTAAALLSLVPYSMNGYGMNGYGQMGNSPNTGGSSGAAPAAAAVAPAAPAEEPEPEAIDPTAALNALGLPAANGYVAWPLGLRALAPAPETTALRQQLDTLLPWLAVQAAQGQTDAQVVREASQSVAHLRRLLAARAADLPLYTRTEAQQFLARLDTVLQGMAH